MNKIVLLLMLSVQYIFAQSTDGHSVSQSLRGNVVVITTDEQSGFGFIVAEQSKVAYIVTARHVVDEAKSITVMFYNNPPIQVNAKNCNLRYKNLDIALLSATMPDGHKWNKACYSDELNQGASAWYIGRNKGWYIPTGAAVCTINSVGPREEIYLDQSSILPGTSGAPLVTNRGIVGMVLAEVPAEAEGFRIKDIRDIIKVEWNYPFQLEESMISGDKTLFKGSLPHSTRASYGGPPYCFFFMRNDTVKVQIKLSIDKTTVESARVTFRVREIGKIGNGLETDDCPFATVPPNTHMYTMETSSINGNTVEIKLKPDGANNPQCSLTFKGTIEGNKVVARLENKRIDQIPQLTYTILMDVQLEATIN